MVGMATIGRAGITSCIDVSQEGTALPCRKGLRRVKGCAGGRADRRTGSWTGGHEPRCANEFLPKISPKWVLRGAARSGRVGSSRGVVLPALLSLAPGPQCAVQRAPGRTLRSSPERVPNVSRTCPERVPNAHPLCSRMGRSVIRKMNGRDIVRHTSVPTNGGAPFARRI